MALALSDDIIFQDILIRQPFKSLVRFRCVCKLWKSVLSAPDFIQPRLNRSIFQNPNDEYLIRTWPGGVAILSRTNLCEIPMSNIPYPVPCPDYLHMVGSINGLVCLARLLKPQVRFILWNSAIHLSKEILLPVHHPFCYRYGFSWDSVSNDYKLIAIPSGRASMCTTHWSGFVYSSKTNCWTNITDPPLVEGLNFPSVIVKGIPYWKCLMQTAILKFEARNNEFTCFTVSKDVGKRYNLVNLNDCLARIEFAGRGKADSMDVYQYTEENNGWCKMSTVTFTENVISSCPVCFKYGGKIVFNGSFYLTDSKSTQIKRLAYQRNIDIGIHGHSYTPSLVVLEGMKPVHRLGEIPKHCDGWHVHRQHTTSTLSENAIAKR